MSKAKLLVVVLSLLTIASFIISGCENRPEDAVLSASPEIEGTPTQRIIPTYVPTATPKPRPTRTPTPAPTSSPTPVPTFTPAPIPTSSPTPVLKGELGAETLADILANTDGDIRCGTRYCVTEGADGTVYYMNNGAIYGIDRISGETTKILDEKEIEEEIDLGMEYSFFTISRIFFADKEFYAGIAIVNPDGNYNHCVIDVLNRKMTEIPDGDIYSHYDDKLFMLDYDYDTNECSYYIYDIVRKKRIVLLDSIDWHEYIILKFVTDKYLIFDRGKWTEDSEGDNICSYMTVVVDRNSLEIVNTISEDELDKANIYILLRSLIMADD